MTIKLHHDRAGLGLIDTDHPQTKPVVVDFPRLLRQRERTGGLSRQSALARAIGLQTLNSPNVIDATAGLGSDGIILAACGCRVHMIERQPLVYNILEDGLRRAKENPESYTWIAERVWLTFADSLEMIKKILPRPDVIYLDPMFPKKQKSALVKKEMQLFQRLIGPEEDETDLFLTACDVATNRVVVKRPVHAPGITNKHPTFQISTKLNRFDVYITH